MAEPIVRNTLTGAKVDLLAENAELRVRIVTLEVELEKLESSTARARYAYDRLNEQMEQNIARAQGPLHAPASPAQEPVTGADWTEDFGHENGRYQCGCVHCGRAFYGHKRRVECRICAAPVAAAWAPPSALAGRLEALLDFHKTGSKAHSHEFHAASVESALRIIAAASAPAAQEPGFNDYALAERLQSLSYLVPVSTRTIMQQAAASLYETFKQKSATPAPAAQPVAGFVPPFSIRNWNTALADTGDYRGNTEVHDANGTQVAYWGDDLDDDAVDAAANAVCAALNAPVTHPPEARQTEPHPISEVSIPMAEVLRTKCQGCGKSPMDFLA